MKNNTYNKRISLWLYLCLFCSLSFAQSNQEGAVKGTRTDKNFANTTAIYKSEKASDEQVLTEIEGDYGLGDVIRISNAAPASVVLPAPVLPKTVESINPLPTPQILPVSHFKLPKTGIKKDAKYDEKNEKNKEEEPLASTNSTDKLKIKEIPSEKKGSDSKNTPNEMRIERGNKDGKNAPSETKKDLTDLPSEKLKKGNNNNNLLEKSDKNVPLASVKKAEKEESKTSQTTADKKKTTAIVSTDANKKWMANNLASSTNSNRRTHRSTVTYTPQKKSWFPFFGKKKTSKMPKTVKNKKSDRCYKF
jgi:hypothetical protein